MKKIAVFFAVMTIALGALCLVQARRLSARDAELAMARAQQEALQKQIEASQENEQRAGEERRELVQRAEDLAAQLGALGLGASNRVAAPAKPVAPALPAAPEKADPAKGGFGNFLSKMMEDPNTRQFIRDQQRTVMDQLYSPLIKQLGLTPEEAARFKDLLADHAMKATEKASSLFSGASATNRAELTAMMTADQKGFEDQVKAFLGEDRYQRYTDYQQTAGERMQLNAYKQQTTGENALTDQQTEQLLTFMSEEKKNLSSLYGQFSGTSQEQGLQAMLSEDQAEKLMQAQEDVNQRVYQRAQGILSPDQMASFGKFQTNQLQMMRMGMSMARKFMAPGE